MTDIRKKAEEESAFTKFFNGAYESIPLDAYPDHPDQVTKFTRVLRQFFEAGYAASEQGRRWRDIYKEGYPELMTPVLLYREGSPLVTGWVDRENDEDGAIFWSEQNGDESLPHDYFTHWQPLPTLPQGEQ